MFIYIGIRSSLNALIQKCERQIEELQVLIEFMRYVKGIGFVPTPPSQLMGSSSFKDYLTHFIEHLDEDRRIKKALEVVEYASDIDNIEDISSDEIERMQTIYIVVKMKYVGELYDVRGPYDTFENAEEDMDVRQDIWGDSLERDEYLCIVRRN